jgi:hypothetical protein
LPPHPPADPNEAAAITSIIERASELKGRAARSFDTSLFHTVFLDDPSSPLTPEQYAFIQRVLPYLRGRVADPGPTPGYLSFWTITFANWQLGAERLDQQRLGTPIAPQNGPIGPPRRTDALIRSRLRIDDIKVDGNRAEVVMDDGLVLWRLYLLKTAAGWRITRDVPLKVHF